MYVVVYNLLPSAYYDFKNYKTKFLEPFRSPLFVGKVDIF